MKKFNKIMTVLMAVVAVFAFVSPVFASSPISSTITGVTSNTVGSADEAVGRAWNTIKLILQIAAIGAVVFAGVRYMFASADQKADIKKSMGILVVGAALVFGATIIIDFIQGITNELVNTP